MEKNITISFKNIYLQKIGMEINQIDWTLNILMVPSWIYSLERL